MSGTELMMMNELICRIDSAVWSRLLNMADGLIDRRVCGQSLVKEKCPCPIYGIEHNEQVGRIAAEWAAKYGQVHVIIGDALRLDYSRFTVLSLARSFLPKTFLAFVEQLEETLTHPVTLIYWYDQQSAHLLTNRPGWKMLTREIITRIHGIKIYSWPQGFSIWRYEPGCRAKNEAGDE